MYKFDEEEIVKVIKNVPFPHFNTIKKIVKKALNFENLDLFEICSLLKTYRNHKILEYVIKNANILKEEVFGNKVKIYIPVYITNKCANNCIYCGFRKDNDNLQRKRLTLDEFNIELDYVLDIGHRNIELVLGYDQELKGEKLIPYIEMIAKKLEQKGGGSFILMSEPMDIEDYIVLKKSGLNEVYCWQETYNQERYCEIHPKGTHKHNYNNRVTIYDRIINAGIQRYGMAILFGLYNFEYDVLALLNHAKWLNKEYGLMPYALGIPRLKKAEGTLIHEPFYEVTDDMYKLTVAVFRLAFPDTHIYMNTREKIDLILDLLKAGGSEVNIEASTVPGGYSGQFKNGEQFFHYTYNSENVFNLFQKLGLEPSYK